MERRGIRRLSTNHLMGEGYWVWIIPLRNDATSVGVVADPRFHPFEEMDTFEHAMDWLRRHEPQLADDVSQHPDEVEDFLRAQDFAHGCTRVFSPDRWCITGIAGVFVDPLYSPGSDFIAQANTMITELVGRDLAGEEIRRLAPTLDSQYLTTFETAIRGTYT